MENSTLSKEKSLEIINEMIAITRNKLIDDGFHFLLWGNLIVLACIVQFVMIYFFEKNAESNWVWMIMPLIGVPLSIIYGKKKKEKAQSSDFFSKIYMYLWIGFGISLFLTIFISILYQHSPTSFIMIITGFAVFVSGNILKFQPLKWGALIFWLGSLCYPMIEQDAFQALFYALVVSIGYLIPGYMLSQKYKKEAYV